MNTLERAIDTDDIEGVRRFLEDNESLQFTDYSDYNILLKSIRWRRKEIVQLLVKNGFRVNKDNFTKCEGTPLHAAIENVCPEIIKILLDRGADVDLKNSLQETPLFMAFKNDWKDLTDLMLPLTKKNQRSYEGISHMHIACARNNVEVVKEFLRSGVQIDHAVSSHSPSPYAGYTPLHFAVYSGNVKIVQLLVNCGADVTIKNSGGLTPLHVANKFRNSSLIDAMLSFHQFNGANPINPDGTSHFHIACTQNRPKIVEGFLQRGEDVNMQIPTDSLDWPGFTPLHFAIEYGCQDIVELLLAHGADVKMVNKRNICPLKYATQINNNKAIELINSREKIIKKKETTKSNSTRVENLLNDLHVACTQDHLSAAVSVIAAVSELKRQGESIDIRVDLDSPSYPGCTALHIAVIHKNSEITELLLKNDAKITFKDARGWTPLHIAFLFDQKAMVDMIISEHSYDGKNPVDSSGLSHLHIICCASGDDQTSVPKFFRIQNQHFIANTSLWYEDTSKSLNESVNFQCSKPTVDSSANRTLTKIFKFLSDNTEKINSSVDCNSMFWPGYTPLHFAIKFRTIETVRMLLGTKFSDLCKEKGHDPVDISIVNRQGQTPLDLAVECLNSSKTLNAQNPYVEIIELILSVSEKRKLQNFMDRGFTLLHIACLQNKEEAIERNATSNNINKSIDLNSPCWAGCTPLHLAVGFRFKSAAKLLLNKGADVNIKDKEGNTPLHLIFKTLKSEEVSPVKDNRVRPRLRGRLSTIGLSRWARNRNDIEDQDRTRQEHRVRRYHADPDSVWWFKLLVDAGAEVNARNLMGETPAHVAVRKDFHPDLVGIMIRHGIDLNASYDEGVTPFSELIACHGYHAKNSWVLEMAQRIKLLKLMDQPVSFSNQRCYHLVTVDESTIEQQYYKEASDMRSTRINYRFSLYDLLTLSVDEMSRLVTNDPLRERIDSPDFDDTFKICGFLLKLQFKRGLAKRDLLDRAQESITVLTGIQLPYGISDLIFQHISDSDLRSLIRANVAGQDIKD